MTVGEAHRALGLDGLYGLEDCEHGTQNLSLSDTSQEYNCSFC
jgi:hypothetical protein